MYRRQFLRGTGVALALPWMESLTAATTPSNEPPSMSGSDPFLGTGARGSRNAEGDLAARSFRCVMTAASSSAGILNAGIPFAGTPFSMIVAS